MKKIFIKCLVLLFTIPSCSINAQENEDEHKEGDHIHHRNEIGIANSPVYFIKEKVVSYGLHLHYLRKLGGSAFGLGLGIEHIFDAHQHSTFGIVGSFSPYHGLNFNLSPGLTFEGNEFSELGFALHFEASYEFEIRDLHLGPLLEIAYDKEDYHLSLGLHIGFGF